MEVERLTLVGSSSCAPCKVVKRMLEAEGIQYDYVIIETNLGRELVEYHNLRAVPSLLIPSTTKRAVVATGMPKIKEVIQAIGEV